jgi:Domain of unknown function (DUF6438)
MVYLKMPEVDMCRSHLAAVLLAMIAAPLLGRSQAAQPEPAAATQTIPGDTMITLQRGNCEGGCPVYRVIIFSDGDVIWHGQDHAAKNGLVLSHIEPNQIRALLAGFQAMDYFHLQHIYGYGEKGCPRADVGKVMTRTTLVTGGRSQTMSHYAGCAGPVPDRKRQSLDYRKTSGKITRTLMTGTIPYAARSPRRR